MLKFIILAQPVSGTIMDIKTFFQRISKEAIIKLSIALLLFLATLGIFRLFQDSDFYNATLNKIAFTYQKEKKLIKEVEKPFVSLSAENMINWDGEFYNKIRKYYYDKGECCYAFFPLFPLLWKIIFVDETWIGLVNYLLFAISIIIFSSFLVKKNSPLSERLCVFALALILPTVTTYYLPYAEALYTLTFALAIWGLVKNKYWIYFTFILLFAMTRPSITIFAISIILLDIFYLLKHRNFLHFIKELIRKLLPVALGTFIVFFLFYLNSGSWTKYFEVVNKYWFVSFSIPKTITDWSVEGFGMNIFTLFFMVLPVLVLFIFNALKVLRAKPVEKPPGIFSGDMDFIKEYFFNNAMIHFWGVFLFIVFYQGGSLNGLSRYVFVSPFFYIFFFVLYDIIKEARLYKILLFSVLSVTGSLLVLLNVPDTLQPEISFTDTGFFALLASFVYLFLMRYMNRAVRISLLIILAVYNIIWIAFLYNIFLCDGWLFT
ncbi:MAG: hypothetical protein HY958_03345 [Bacteroidia bacterium]|nr:hypothetical protein [Bacteroidia bacterium]